MRLGTTLLIALTAFALPACRPDEPQETAAAESSQLVLTTFYPAAYLAERIAGGLVDVECPLPVDEDPATWEPDAHTIVRYQSARLIIVNGASFEQWVPKAPLPRSRVVDTTAAQADQLLHYAATVTHSHGTSGTHSHEGIDGHTWLDPMMAIAQAQAISERLVDVFPEHADAFRRNTQALLSDLRSLDRELAELAPAMESVTVVCSHPAYNYLGKRYGWQLLIAPLDPDSDATPDELESLARAVADSPPRLVVLWESPTSQANEQSIRDAIGATSVLYSPCEHEPEQGDFLSVMRENIARLRSAVSVGG